MPLAWRYWVRSLSCLNFLIAFGLLQAIVVAKPKLSVTTAIRDQQTCLVSGDRIQVSLELTVTFRNRAESPLIISRNSTESGLLIAHTLTRANDRRFERTGRGDLWDFPFTLQGDSPDASWLILKPDEAYDREIKVWGLGPFTRQEYRHYEGTTHFIRLELFTVDTFLVARQNKDLSVSLSKKELIARWKNYGYLWLDGATSEPMSVQFPVYYDLKSCK